MVLFCAATGLAHGDTFKVYAKQFNIGPYPTDIVAVDLNDDGIPEILTTDRGRLADPREEKPAEDYISYLVAREPMKYQTQPQIHTGFGPYALRAVNIDALRAIDLVAVNFMATRNRDLTLVRNLGTDIFEPVHFSVNDEELYYNRRRDGDGEAIFTTPGLTSLAVRDIDGDGYRDVLATGWTSDVLVYFPGDAETYFATPRLIPAPGGPRDVQLGDVNGDGNYDAVVTFYDSQEIGIFEGDGKGGFAEVNRFRTRGNLPHTVALADMNGDKELDIVVSHANSDDSFAIYFHSRGFAFDRTREVMLGTSRGVLEYEIRDLIVADVNGDDRMDVAVTCFASGQVLVYVQSPKSTRANILFNRETYTFKEGKPRVLTVSDVNNDKKPDLLVGLWGPNKVAVLLGR